MAAPSTSHTMVVQQFEYVRLFIAQNPSGRWIVNAASLGLTGQTLPGADVDTALAALGLEGWEIVGAPGSAESFHILLKRAKASN